MELTEQFLAFISTISPAELLLATTNGGLWAGIMTAIDTLRWSLVLFEHVVLMALDNLGPVDGLDVAEVGVVCEADSTPGHRHETGQADLLQVLHLKRHDSVPIQQLVTSNHRQVREQTTQGLQPLCSKQEQVFCDFHKVGERVFLVVLHGGGVYEEDGEVALDDSAVLQDGQLLHLVADVQTRAD